MKRLAATVTIVLVLASVSAWPDLDPGEYTRITQCVLVRERPSMVGEKVQLTGNFVAGSKFCYDLRGSGINTRDFACFALGEPCLIRLYLKKDHPQIELLQTLRKDDVVTAYGVFDYLGSSYNYMVLDGIEVKERR